MPLLSSRSTPGIRIDLPVEGEWVILKSAMSRGDEVAITKAALKSAQIKRGPDGDITTEIDAAEAVESAEFAAIEILVREWSFPEPINAANIRDLDPVSIRVIKDAIERMTVKRTDDEEKNSSTKSLPVSTVILDGQSSLVSSD